VRITHDTAEFAGASISAGVETGWASPGSAGPEAATVRRCRRQHGDIDRSRRGSIRTSGAMEAAIVTKLLSVPPRRTETVRFRRAPRAAGPARINGVGRFGTASRGPTPLPVGRCCRQRLGNEEVVSEWPRCFESSTAAILREFPPASDKRPQEIPALRPCTPRSQGPQWSLRPSAPG
jgi:hypothetical protein